MRLDSKLVHAGDDREAFGGAGVIPVIRSTIFEHGADAAYHDIRYPRLSTLPNQVQVARTLAAVEGGEAALVTSSGMAAISTTLLTLLAGGGHAIAHRTLYGGTQVLMSAELPGLGIETTFVDASESGGWEAAVRPETRVIYVEAMTNPTLEVADHRAVVAFARAHRLVSAIDSTFASPVNFRPLELGYDVVLHSATKYLNGHSDLVAGVVVASAERIAAIKRRLDHLGGCLDPEPCYLLQRGLKTLGLRVRRQNQSALAVARHLEGRAGVSRVIYPGLESHPHHARARELFSGFGGMLAIELEGGEAAARRFTSSVQLALHSASLGGVETLVTRPAATSHAGLAPAERDALGVTAALVRISIGIEDPADIIEDLERALS
jgi:cystathionine beta-lyase/cystathionine gamma-synthase